MICPYDVRNACETPRWSRFLPFADLDWIGTNINTFWEVLICVFRNVAKRCVIVEDDDIMVCVEVENVECGMWIEEWMM